MAFASSDSLQQAGLQQQAVIQPYRHNVFFFFHLVILIDTCHVCIAFNAHIILAEQRLREDDLPKATWQSQEANWGLPEQQLGAFYNSKSVYPVAWLPLFYVLPSW